MVWPDDKYGNMIDKMAYMTNRILSFLGSNDTFSETHWELGLCRYLIKVGFAINQRTKLL